MRNIRSRRVVRRRKFVIWSSLSILFITLGVGLACFVWYAEQLKPVNHEDKRLISVNIESGSGPSFIAQTLKKEGVINNARAFSIYTRMHGVENNLQAGRYRLSPSEDMRAIVDHLVKGNTDSFNVIFYPGATLTDSSSKTSSEKQDITSSLLNVGFSEQEVEDALKADYSEYNNTLFQGRPSSADLEGYIYGDTYALNGSSTASDALRASFDQFWNVVQKNNLIQGFKSQGLSLYEGITLASIVQRESIGGDEPDIAQVFYNRLAKNDMLGSDVTYQYIADKLGIPRSTTLQSPYNTRVNPGLPPGPIATPGIKSLMAVANPSKGDYYYFLSGDDDVTYFALTLREHEANIVNHCKVKCQII